MKRIALALLFLVSATLTVPVQAAEEKGTDTYKYLDLFGAVFERVRSGYVEKVTDKKLIEAAINGMLQALDPHSSYLNAKNFREMQATRRSPSKSGARASIHSMSASSGRSSRSNRCVTGRSATSAISG